MVDVTQTTLDVTIGSDPNKEVLTFRIPTVREYAKIGARAHEFRRADAPTTGGGEWGIDITSADLYRGMALMEILLARADAKDNWPFSTDTEGKPVVDSSKFPAQSTMKVIEAYRGFEESFRNFLEGGT